MLSVQSLVGVDDADYDDDDGNVVNRSTTAGLAKWKERYKHCEKFSKKYQKKQRDEL